jgi:hypothetical protein
MDGDSVPCGVFFRSVFCEAALTGAFVPAEADVEGLVGLFFSADMDDRALVGLFPAELDDVIDPVAAALLALCCFATDFRFLG